jgi:hypothetical protein
MLDLGKVQIPFWLKTSTSLSVTTRPGSLSAGTALIMGYDFLRSHIVSGEDTGVLRSMTSGTNSRILLESVYRLASSITNRVIAIPLEGPRKRRVSSPSSSRTKPPGLIESSIFWGGPSSSTYWPSSASNARTLSCNRIT